MNKKLRNRSFLSKFQIILSNFWTPELVRGFTPTSWGIQQNFKIFSERCLNFGFILIIVGFISGCADDPQLDKVGAEENLKTGWLEYNNGNYAAALLSFERAISLDDSLSDAHNGLGYSLLSSSSSSTFNPQLVLKALSEFQEAIRRDETNADAWVGLANALFLRRTDASDFKTAVQSLDNALKANSAFLYRHDYSSEADIHALKALCLYYSGDVESASIEVKSALEIDNKNQTALGIQNFIKSR